MTIRKNPAKSTHTWIKHFHCKQNGWRILEPRHPQRSHEWVTKN
jgi:hypothetical protein